MTVALIQIIIMTKLQLQINAAHAQLQIAKNVPQLLLTNVTQMDVKMVSFMILLPVPVLPVLKIVINVLMQKLAQLVKLNISFINLLLTTLQDLHHIVLLAHQIALNAQSITKMEKKLVLLVQRLRTII